MPLGRLPTYILLIVMMLTNSRQLNSKSRNILAFAAPYMPTAEDDIDYTTSNDNANIIEDEQLNTINLPQLESAADNAYNPYYLRSIPIPTAEDAFKHFTEALTTPNKLEQLERTKLSTILSSQPSLEHKIPYAVYDEGSSTTSGVYSNKCGAMPSIDHKENEEQQEVIDHVTNLIRSMREHAIGIIKDMNDLEMDFLYSTGGNIDSNENKNCNDNNGGNGFNGEIATTAPIDSLCYDSTSTTTSPSPPTVNNCVNTSNKWNNSNASNCNSNTNCKSSSSNNLNNEKNEKKGNMPNYFVNEWSVPTTNENPAIDAKEFMQQAHEAVKSWREQIEACKQILDAAVAQAAHTHHVTNGLFTATEPMISVPVTNNVNKNCDNEATLSSVPLDGSANGNNNNDAYDADKMKKHSIGTQHNENIAQNYDALINTLKGRMQGIWDLSTIP